MNVHVYLVSPKISVPMKKRPRSDGPGSSSSFDIFFERTALFSDSKLGNHFAIAVRIVHSQIIEQTPTLTDNLQQATAGSMVLLVRFEMLGEIRDALTK